jgi:hypothetical protein
MPGAVPEAWVKAADAELYKAKAAGRNSVSGRIFEAVVEASSPQSMRG